MIIRKRYIPARFRSPLLTGAKETTVTAGGTLDGETTQAPPNPRNIVHRQLSGVKTIGDENLNETDYDLHVPFSFVNALKNLTDENFLIKEADTTVATDSNVFTALRTLLEIAENNEKLKAIFLRKDINDIAQGLIKFVQGFEVGEYSTGMLGGGAALKMVDGISELEVDKLTVRMIATFFELVVSKLSHIGGQLILSPARIKVTGVVDGGTYYRCFFEKGENGEVDNEFVAGDQARCQVFSGTGAKMYWRLVTSVGTDWINLSKTDQVGDGIPEVGDEIVQLGNRTDVTRQSAQILSTVGSDAPSYKQYGGINSFSLEGKELTVFSSKGNTIYGRTKFRSSKGTYEDMGEWADTTDQKIDDTKTELEKKIPAIWKVIPTNTNPGAPFYVDEKAKDERMRSISLTVRYTRNGEDVSVTMAKSTQRLYTWGRTNPLGVDDNGVTDEDWTLSNANRDIVTLTPDDIMWVANIYTEFDPVILEQQYNLLK